MNRGKNEGSLAYFGISKLYWIVLLAIAAPVFVGLELGVALGAATGLLISFIWMSVDYSIELKFRNWRRYAKYGHMSDEEYMYMLFLDQKVAECEKMTTEDQVS